MNLLLYVRCVKNLVPSLICIFKPSSMYVLDFLQMEELYDFCDDMGWKLYCYHEWKGNIFMMDSSSFSINRGTWLVIKLVGLFGIVIS